MEARDNARTYLRAMAAFWAVFGLITTFLPDLMQLFMTQEGTSASTAFSDQVWLHGGLDILSVSVLLVALATLPITKTTLLATGIVGLLPTAAIIYTLVATPYWSPSFLIAGAGTFGFAILGFVLAARHRDTTTGPARAPAASA